MKRPLIALFALALLTTACATGPGTRTSQGALHDDDDASVQTDETRVETGDDSTYIETDAATVETGPDGVHISTGEAEIHTGDQGVSVTTGGAAVVVGSGANAGPSGKYKKHADVNCNGAQDVSLDGIKIVSTGVAITANGSCDIKLKNCWIEGSTAISAQGSFDIEIENCVIKGKNNAISAQGAGDIEAKNTEFFGKIGRQGSVDFEDEGGNTFH